MPASAAPRRMSAPVTAGQIVAVAGAARLGPPPGFEAARAAGVFRDVQAVHVRCPPHPARALVLDWLRRRARGPEDAGSSAADSADSADFVVEVTDAPGLPPPAAEFGAEPPSPPANPFAALLRRVRAMAAAIESSSSPAAARARTFVWTESPFADVHDDLRDLYADACAALRRRYLGRVRLVGVQLLVDIHECFEHAISAEGQGQFHDGFGVRPHDLATLTRAERFLVPDSPGGGPGGATVRCPCPPFAGDAPHIFGRVLDVHVGPILFPRPPDSGSDSDSSDADGCAIEAS